VTAYRLAEEIAKLLSEGFRLLDQVIYPELAKMVSTGEAEKIWRLVIRSAVILLSVGLLASLIIWLSLGTILEHFLSDDYREVAPLASLLVPAAALLGMAAPLYPVLYATDYPERAIYARGAGVLVYIVSFFALSATIGHMAPGWAAIAGNLVAVGLVMWLAKQALGKIVREQERCCCGTHLCAWIWVNRREQIAYLGATAPRMAKAGFQESGSGCRELRCERRPVHLASY
jgi:O-antigen/teichoic acid export membrane protein